MIQDYKELDLLIIARNLQFLTSDEFGAVSKPVEDIGKMLNRLIGVLKTRKRAARAHILIPKSRAPRPESRVPSSYSIAGASSSAKICPWRQSPSVSARRRMFIAKARFSATMNGCAGLWRGFPA